MVRLLKIIILAFSIPCILSFSVFATPVLTGLEVVINVKRCNLRSAPDTSKKNIITVLSQNDKATILDISSVKERLWYKVKTLKNIGWVSASLTILDEKSIDFILSDLIYKRALIDLKKYYPGKYFNLYQAVKKYYAKKEFNSLFLDQKDIKPEGKYLEKLIFSASPLSIKKQNKQHKDWVPILVNEASIKKGKIFYEENKQYFEYAEKETGVATSDIIAILNWESRLGKYKGEYDVFKIFTNQYFHIDEIEFELFQAGQYKNDGAMERTAALKRIKKIKKRALNNLTQLLIQAKTKGFNPKTVKGSWAGAIGIPQFMPTSMKFAADGDNDGNIDLNSIPDAILSVATYLKRHNYKERGRKYAFKRYNASDMYVRGVNLYSEKFFNLISKNEITSDPVPTYKRSVDCF